MIEIPVNPDSSENVDYNNKNFPAYIRKGILSNYHDYRAICHWHTDFEFIYVYDGSMKYSVNGSVISLSSGQGVFINSNCLHFGFSDTRSECHFLCVLLHPSLLSSNPYFQETILTPLTENSKLPYIRLLHSHAWQNSIILELLRIENTLGKKNEALNIVQSFINILSLIINHANIPTASIQNDDELSSLTAMIGYVQQNYTDKISIDTLSSVGNCCKTKCNDLFRKYLNMTPLTYLTSYRLEKSTDMLTNSFASISEIAYASGFSSSSYFCETFNKHYGTTPKQYRIQSLKEKRPENSEKTAVKIPI